MSDLAGKSTTELLAELGDALLSLRRQVDKVAGDVAALHRAAIWSPGPRDKITTCPHTKILTSNPGKCADCGWVL